MASQSILCSYLWVFPRVHTGLFFFCRRGKPLNMRSLGCHRKVWKEVFTFVMIILISWGCFTSPTFFFFFFFGAISQFDWPITKKKELKLWTLPKIKDSMERWSAINVLAFISNLRPNNKPKMLKVGPKFFQLKPNVKWA